MKVELKHITKKFPGRVKGSPEVLAVNDFDFVIPDGTLVALLGPSGCGKSTILNMICGLLEPTEGQIIFGDTEVTSLQPEERGVGMVFQNYALYPHMTVLQNIRFPLENFKGKQRLSKHEMNARSVEAAKIVQIDHLLDRKPSAMSGGQQQRVAIARALVKMPRVLLLDEPLSNLDARLRLQTREEIRRIQKETGITTIFVTHDQDEAMSISDIICVMKDGDFQQAGRPQEVYDDPVNLFVAKFLGVPPINVFDGRIENGALYIGNDRITKLGGIDDGEVTVGIRPEGLEPDENGTLVCSQDRIEIMGRDKSVIAGHPASQNDTVRAIIDSDLDIPADAATVRFRIKPQKMYIFSKKYENRLPFTVE